MEEKAKYNAVGGKNTEYAYKTPDDIYQEFLEETKIDSDLIESWETYTSLYKAGITVTLKTGGNIIYTK